MLTPLQNFMCRPIAAACVTLAIAVTCSPIQAQSHRGKKSFGWRRSLNTAAADREADSSVKPISVFGSLKTILPFRGDTAQPPGAKREVPPVIRYENPSDRLRLPDSSKPIVSAARPMRIHSGRSQSAQQAQGALRESAETAFVGQAAIAGDIGTDMQRVANEVARVRTQATGTTAVSPAQTKPADPDTFAQWLKKKVTGVKMPSFSLPFGRGQENAEADRITSASRQSASPRSPMRRDSNVVPAKMTAPANRTTKTAESQNTQDKSFHVIRDPALEVAPPPDRDLGEDAVSIGAVPISIRADEHGVRRYFSPRHPDIAAPGVPNGRSAQSAASNQSLLGAAEVDGRINMDKTPAQQGRRVTSPIEPAKVPTVPSDLRAKPGSKPWHEIPVKIEPRLMSGNARGKPRRDHRAIRELPVNLAAGSIRRTQYQQEGEFPNIEPQVELGGRGATDQTSRPEALPRPIRSKPPRKRVDAEPLTPNQLIRDGLRPIGDIAIDIRPPDGETPPDPAIARFAEAGEEFHASGFNRPWQTYLFAWEAPSVCHRPLYFEEVNLERYGYNHGLLQPAYSAAHFFGRVTILPYLIGAEPPCECVYTLGHDRPGDYVPYRVHYPPPSIKGGLYQAATLSGLIFAIP